MVIQCIMVGLVIGFPQMVMHYKSQPPTIDPSTIEIQLPSLGPPGGLTLPPFDLGPPGAPPALGLNIPPPPSFGPPPGLGAVTPPPVPVAPPSMPRRAGAGFPAPRAASAEVSRQPADAPARGDPAPAGDRPQTGRAQTPGGS